MIPTSTTAPAPIDPAAANAEGKLVRLGVQVEAMQALLVRLLQDIVKAEHKLDHTQAAQLLEANEQLVVSALKSQSETETMALQEAAATPLDPLTGLPNRTTLADRLVQAIAYARRHGNRFALLFLDLDNFKPLNDAHGHAFGDQVLQLVAARMLAVVREGDTVSRHGGDEFLVLLSEVSEAQDALGVAQKLMAAIGAPAELEGQVLRLMVSIGIALYPDHGEDADTLIARADAAMYESKHGGGGCAVIHGAAPVPAPDTAPQAKPRQHSADEAEAQRKLAQLREANEQLVLAALNAQELLDAASEAQQRQAAFMAAVVDELRNPLAPIRIASSMLGRPTDPDPLLPRVQGIVEEQLTRISRLVGGLVDATAVSSGKLELDHRPVDMAAIIDAAIATYRPTMNARDQHFELHRPPGALTVTGDAQRLEQIVSNLIDNASKHTHDGGRISLSVLLSADTLTLTVSDSGIGISRQMLPLIFEPFVQDTHAIGFHGVGLGIGLTVVRELVRAHGGDLVARSTGAGRGSQFVVTLPRGPAPPVPPATEPASG